MWRGVGSHKGYMHYTIGKRRGFEVRGASTPHYVLSINPDKNQIVVGNRDKLRVDSFEIENIKYVRRFSRVRGYC